MHAVIVDVSISNREQAEQELREQVVPMVSQVPGFVSGVWVARGGGKGHSVVVFETEDAANAAADQVRNMTRAAVTTDSVDVGEVVARA